MSSVHPSVTLCIVAKWYILQRKYLNMWIGTVPLGTKLSTPNSDLFPSNSPPLDPYMLLPSGEWIQKSKSKVDNLYHCSKRSRSLQNRYYNTSLVHWTHEWLPHTGAYTWKPSQGTKLYCLVNRGTLVWTTCPRLLLDNAAAGNRTHDLPIASPAP